MKEASYRELQALEELSVNPSFTQRHLAKKLGVALGLTNLMIRRFVNKGYVKVVNIQKNRLQYLITPKGITEKTRLTYAYLEYSLFLYRGVRRVLQERLSRIAQAGGKDVVLFGVGEITEIAYLTLKGMGLNLAGVVDDQAAGQSFLGVRVMRVEELPGCAFDCGIIGSLNHGHHELRRRLQALGIAEERLIIIEQRGAEIAPALPEAAVT
ncbi:MAG: winged helix-turn-helix transcriptional regulator [Candidatus Omnitrophica bacterium]|nr:winged helix-turn-helix transcriptional regulator [Candidatus Omnitrophota bacterium]